MKISVLICTHNPRKDYLDKTLDGLKKQNLERELWELLLIDNASEYPIAEKYDLSWHPNARYLYEKSVGKPHAIVLGITESKGDLIVFVDDDNVLQENYLKEALYISEKFTLLGVWSGNITPEFETEPFKDTISSLPLLTIRNITCDSWGSYLNNQLVGAGMCIRRDAALLYVKIARYNEKRLILGRVGTCLGGHEDIDLAYCALDIGYGSGVFSKLKLTHLIPSRRLQKEYLLKLQNEMSLSHVVFLKIRSINENISGHQKILNLVSWIYIFIRSSVFRKKMLIAELQGKIKAKKHIGNC